MDAVGTKNAVLAVLAAIGSFLVNLLGGWGTDLAALMCMMGIDYFTGIATALWFKKSTKSETGKFKSGESFKGLVRKLMILVLVWVGSMLDGLFGSEYIRTAVCLFFIANEGLSILENTALMGVPYPKFIKVALEALKDKTDNNDGGK